MAHKFSFANIKGIPLVKRKKNYYNEIWKILPVRGILDFGMFTTWTDDETWVGCPASF